ncbi:tripartite tricarboxylate transporter TctB family protein [Clostridium cochlearium]|uniref:tripartite tricarboxylate transporter TctB family protein n=1 Tax=Clostridium cochlearium TaxID=1494 RepID=UPI001EDDB279|nr:tripartite tricarboxylate transporter TctB family protein [Clostridium cochlearium]MBV1820014.1 tripartite tricarboxylate transporter TctB family protein [Bacteroidales bacterium MSK.15.36]MCG4571246.1 tripartite tricarboxylate transporter TctB family protein [Clostridium cochlearium]
MKRDNYILVGIISLISLIFFIMNQRLPEKARVYPNFILGLMVFLIILLIIETKTNKSLQGSSNLFENFEKKQFLIVFISAVSYIVLLDIVGYFTTTVVYILSTLIMLKVDKSKSAFITIGFTAFIYVIFSMLLKVPLPKGLII